MKVDGYLIETSLIRSMIETCYLKIKINKIKQIKIKSSSLKEFCFKSV